MHVLKLSPAKSLIKEFSLVELLSVLSVLSNYGFSLKLRIIQNTSKQLVTKKKSGKQSSFPS